MKRILFFVAFFVFIVTSASAQIPAGFVKDNLTVKSKLLNKDIHYAIYLPPDYKTSERDYPVVYLFHGYSDNQWGWIQFGEVNIAADKAIAERKIPPMIIVMPDAEVSWYINDYKSANPFEDMFFQEFIPGIESAYRIRAKKEFRAVCGLSMGGFGSLIYALHRPDMFAACAPFSAGIFTDDEIINMPENRYNIYFAKIYGENLAGKDRLTNHWKKNNVLDLVKNISEEQKKAVKFYIDCGDDDFLYKGNSNLHILMSDLNIPHEFRIRNGSHDWKYWRSGITDALEFIGESFHR